MPLLFSPRKGSKSLKVFVAVLLVVSVAGTAGDDIYILVVVVAVAAVAVGAEDGCGKW